MTDPGFKGITVKKDLWEALQQAYEAEYPKKRLRPSFASWVSDMLWESLEKGKK